MERPTTSNMMPKRDQERDLELDKKIEALRRKNEALMKRYKEVEEDRRKAEEEGMALQSRKGKADDLTITISKSMDESRVVVTKPFGSGSPIGTGQQEGGADRVGEGSTQGTGRGSRKQLTVTMAGKKGKRVVSERPEKQLGPTDVKSPLDEGQTRQVESAGRGKQLCKTTKRESSSAVAVAAKEEIKQGPMNAEEQHKDTEQLQEPESPQPSTDLNIPTSREEQEEYLRWKKEREQIDRERVARHKNAKGQWRRAWDMDKTENMFSDKSLSDRDWAASARVVPGGRNARRGSKAGSKGHEKRGKDKAAKNVLVMSSKAKGKDRLTGRARRWQDNDDGENTQTTETTLEEFLEELDALTDANEGNLKDQDSKAKPDPLSAPEDSDSLKEDKVTQRKAATSSPRGLEKKVRFSEELIQRVPAKQTTTSLHSAAPESKGSLKASSPNHSEVQRPQLACVSAEQDGSSSQDKGGGLPSPSVAQQQTSKTENVKKDTSSPEVSSVTSGEKTSTSPHESPVQPVEESKCNSSSTNTEELKDSTLSVLRIDSGESHPAHSTSNDKAREHGKVV
ncbi:coiled-coil domain-containing protein 9B isoform X1 [Xiphophorus couchianus]|uniref:coiled-coil domain-containing protein 9B isoform X1 n=1 Tax=Xiphophorus couchianus TaxID=32473 RepID=UPI001015CB4A|nr:coiled-coil domain-containing protein 9B isoform X1 [Xiphophorus couchianus]